MRPEHFSEQFDLEDNPYNDYDKWRDLRDERDFRAGLRGAALYTKYAEEREAQQDAAENDGVSSPMDVDKNSGFEERELRD
jgi:hypothetical protein